MRRVMLLAAVVASLAGCTAELGPSFEPEVTPTPGERVWRSWEIVTRDADPAAFVSSADGELEAEIEVYARALDGTLTPLGAFEAGPSAHPSRVQDRWHRAAGEDLPYVGKSSVPRGADEGEGAASEPLGVSDLQFHPAADAEAVIAFVVPTSGRYAVFALEVRQPLVGCDGADGSALSLAREGFETSTLDASAPAGMPSWSHLLGALDAGPMTAGERIFVGVGAQENAACDATELAFVVRRRP